MTRRTIYSRPSMAPSAHIPLGARDVGHYILPAGFREPPFRKHFLEVFWGVRGSGVFVIDGEEHRLHPSQIAVYMPGMVHEFRAIEKDWEFRWWTMDGPLAADIAAALGLAPGVFDAGPVPSELFEQLAQAIRDISMGGERHASVVAYELLTRTRAAACVPAGDVLINEVLRFMECNWHLHSLSVSFLARRFKVHRSTLARRFQDVLGITPVDYIAGLRVQNAMALLQQTSHTVAEIADHCGYSDAAYFARMFRKRTGKSPLGYRKHGR